MKSFSLLSTVGSAFVAVLSACGSPSKAPQTASAKQAASTAAPQKFECSEVGGTEEWRVSIDLEKKTATFFDNDANAVAVLKETRYLESLPPQTLYIFEGKDVNGGPGALLRIEFNETRGKATVVLAAGTSKEERLEAAGGCKAVTSRAPAKPASDLFECADMGGTEEWRVSIDLKANEATFFDNDANIVVALKETKLLESLPPQTLYIFEGDDTGGGEGAKLRVLFNRTKGQATVVTDVGTPEEKSFEAEGGCKALKR